MEKITSNEPKQILNGTFKINVNKNGKILTPKKICEVLVAQINEQLTLRKIEPIKGKIDSKTEPLRRLFINNDTIRMWNISEKGTILTFEITLFRD